MHPETNLRDYVDWHRKYDDPNSAMSWRLSLVRRHITTALEETAGPMTALSLCAGDGRDLVGVLRERADADRVHAVLVELEPDLAAAAAISAETNGLSAQLDVRVGDAGRSGCWADAVPADLVLLVGIFGNISDDDLWRTVDAAPALCRPGATLVWSRGLDRTDRNDAIRARFTARGFTELAYDERDDGSRPALGAVRYDGPPVALADLDGPLFTFIR